MTTGVGLVALTGMLVWLIIFDQLAGISSIWWVLGVAGLVGVVIGGGTWWVTRSAVSLVGLFIFLAVLVLVAATELSPVKPFMGFYRSISHGMTEDEVMAAMESKFPMGGKWNPPVAHHAVGPDHLSFILDPADWRYNAEIVAVDFQAGRVVEKRYLGD
jgi:hypothetical protein